MVPQAGDDDDEEEEEEEEEYGPTLPVPGSVRDVTYSGPTIPNMQDLELKRGEFLPTPPSG
jgi:hypothetical protein